MNKYLQRAVMTLSAICLAACLFHGTALPVRAASAAVWDGTVDLSWYRADAEEYHLTTPAQLAGLAALVNGCVDGHCTDEMIIGDRKLLKNKKNEEFTFPGQTVHNGIAYEGQPEYSFADKTIYLEADMDMGGDTQTTNWMPIGGLFPTDPEADDYYNHMVSAWFAGTIEGNGHRITNLYCDRETPLFYYSQGIGLIGQIGTYDDQEKPKKAPAVRNLSVSGFVAGGRMAGGIVGRTGSEAGPVYIENCANHASVQGEQSKGKGGILGVSFGSGAIINCYNDGTVTSSYSTAPCGGIIGDNEDMDLYCCYSVGKVTANYGRAIGSGDSNTAQYTVSDCYYLLGSDSDASAGGWYRGSNKLASVNVTGLEQKIMQTTDLVSYLNVNGNAFVYNPGGYPRLFWETEDAASVYPVTVEKPEGGTVTVSCGSTARAGQIVYLSNESEPGYAFRKYIVNGSFVTGDYFMADGNTTVSGSFSSLRAGILDIPYNPVCTITVKKAGTIEVDGEAVAVTGHPVSSGDLIYENDILQITAAYREGAYPEDPNLVYLGMAEPDSASAWKYAFTYTGETEEFTTSPKHTVLPAINEEGAALTLTIEPQTTYKRWSSLADTSWYDSEKTDFSIGTARELAGLIALVRDGNDLAGQTVTLSGDISLRNDDGSTGIRCWDGIGTGSCGFAGTLDGGGHRILDMDAYSAGSYTGLFSFTSGAVIRNLSVSGQAQAQGGAAGLVSQCSNTTVENCRCFVEVSESSQSGGNGGIAARASGATMIRDCVNYYPVSGADAVGGIVGELAETRASVCDCVNFGDITGNGNMAGSKGIGGVIGRIASGSSVKSCANYGDVSGGSQYVGGICGSMNGSSTNFIHVEKCYNTGSVENCRAAGSRAAGGIAGYFNYAVVADCYNYGTVTGPDTSEHVGAVFGWDRVRSGASVSNVHYLRSASEYVTDSGPGRGASDVFDVTPRDAASFAGESFLTVLNNGSSTFVLSNGTYPELPIAVTQIHVHSGGTADCASPAVCDSCGNLYGEKDPDHHTGETVRTGQKDPVWTTDGYTGDLCCADCGAVLETGTAIPADSSKIVFTVYEKHGGREQTTAKTYTAAEFSALEDDSGTLLYQYGQGASSQRYIAAARYVRLADLLQDAGVSFAEGDTLTPENASAVPYDYISSRDGYYRTDEEGKTQKTVVPPVIAISHGEAPLDPDTAAEDCKVTGTLRLCYGIKEEEYLNVGGFRLVSNLSYILITHPVCDADAHQWDAQSGTCTKCGLPCVHSYEGGFCSICGHKEPERLAGDVNLDGAFDIADIDTSIQYYRLLLELSDEALNNGDINRDGRLDIADINTMIRFYRKKIRSLD